jgi:hypothetical protein
VRSIKAKFVLENGRGVRPIPIPILHLFLYYEFVLIDVGDDGRVVQVGNIDDQMHFCIEMNNPLLKLVFSCMHKYSNVVFFGDFQVYRTGLIDWGNVDLVSTSVS